MALRNDKNYYAGSRYRRRLILILSIVLLLNVNQFRCANIPSVEYLDLLTLDYSDSNIIAPSYFRQAPNGLRTPLPRRKDEIQKDLVKSGDFIYYKNPRYWNSSPIVIESHKLVFFSIPKVGCTVWKQLFRRIMGHENWQLQDEKTYIPHNPETSGLKYLYDYSLEEASTMMTSPEWKRAIMVRDPKERLLSAFLDKAVSNDRKHIRNSCCSHDEVCVANAQTVQGFLKLAAYCDDEHWRPQHRRMETKYWPYVDFVLHAENAFADSKRMMQDIGAWDDYGKSGWGPDGSLAMFESKGTKGAGKHATHAEWQVWKWYTPEAETEMERFYQSDYENPLFNFTRAVCLTCTSLKQY